jgi:hypothetical protein
VPLMAFLGFDAPMAQSIRGEGGPRTTRIGDCTIHAVVVLTVSNERGTTSSALATQGQSCSARSLEDETLERLVLEVADVLAAQPQLLADCLERGRPATEAEAQLDVAAFLPVQPPQARGGSPRLQAWKALVWAIRPSSRCALSVREPVPTAALLTAAPHGAYLLSVACTRARALVRPVRAVLISSSL